ncbi:peptidase M48 Ste24p [Sphingomonas sp. Root710]|uniref:M48 family metalloprotease n=1 Tax=Sphingomonas sp. Root710 TaxID=1736594 RepID=UPI0006FADD87|nr:M48 family metalloprotease [Sphingomonas sp. Root710]KRB85710.1 peptidase M48 Ste24p [Sphingomonas sp. Root710]
MKKTALFLALLLAAPSAPVLAQAQAISASDKKAGSEAHPQLVQQFGGAMRGPAADYVTRVGRKIAVQSGLSNSERDFTVTLLDSPVNNAFAIPGGYVYVTRGLLALMNDEAELASVLGHEIGHVAARHSAKRQQTNTIAQVLAGVVGAVAGNSGIGDLVGRGAGLGADLITKGFSRTQEYQADDLGVRYLAGAGYDPLGSADMLAILGAQQSLEARISGQKNSLPTWASTHPNSTDRVKRARDKASQTGAAGRGQRNRDALLDAVDGLTWGDNPEKGYVEGREFRLPVQRLAFTVPSGYAINNADDAVTIAGSGGQASFTGGRVGMGGLDDYVSQVFAGLGGSIRAGQIQTGKANGMDFRYAFGQANSNAGQVDVGVFAYRPDSSAVAYHFVTIARAGQGIGPFAPLVESMRRMSSSEATGIKPLKIRVVRVKAGDTPESLAKQMAFPDNPLDRFLVLNGMQRGQTLKAGDRVKLVVR